MLLGWSLALPLYAIVIVCVPAAAGMPVRLAMPSLRLTVPRIVEPSLEAHGADRRTGARADDADRRFERERLAERRRRGRVRHDNLWWRSGPQ